MITALILPLLESMARRKRVAPSAEGDGRASRKDRRGRNDTRSVTPFAQSRPRHSRAHPVSPSTQGKPSRPRLVMRSVSTDGSPAPAAECSPSPPPAPPLPLPPPPPASPNYIDLTGDDDDRDVKQEPTDQFANQCAHVATYVQATGHLLDQTQDARTSLPSPRFRSDASVFPIEPLDLNSLCFKSFLVQLDGLKHSTGLYLACDMAVSRRLSTAMLVVTTALSYTELNGVIINHDEVLAGVRTLGVVRHKAQIKLVVKFRDPTSSLELATAKLMVLLDAALRKNRENGVQYAVLNGIVTDGNHWDCFRADADGVYCLPMALSDVHTNNWKKNAADLVGRLVTMADNSYHS